MRWDTVHCKGKVDEALSGCEIAYKDNMLELQKDHIATQGGVDIFAEPDEFGGGLVEGTSQRSVTR